MSSINFFMKYCWKNNKKYVIYTFLYQLFNSLMPLIVVILPKFIIDELLGNQRSSYLIFYVALLLGYQLIGGFLANFFKKQAFIQKSILFITFQSELTHKMATADFEQIESANFLNQKEKAAKFLYGNGQGFGAVFDHFASILGNCFVFIGIIGVISILNGYLLLVFIILAIVTSYFDHLTKKKYVAWDMEKAPVERKTNYLVHVIESFQYAKEIRIYHLAPWLTKKVDQHLAESNEFYTKQVTGAVRVENVNLLSSFIRDMIAYTFLISQFIAKKLTIGEFTMYITAINTFSVLLKEVLASLTTIRQYQDYFEALTIYLNMPQMREQFVLEDNAVLKEPLELTFEQVSFKYPLADKNTLENISFTVRKGDKVAIVGENGSGKTTLIKLICRLYEPTSGRILLNGQDIQELDFNSYTQLIATVFQDFRLFSFSIRDNLVFDNPKKISDVQLEKVLAKNGFQLSKYSLGLSTPVFKNFDETGFEPSGGEAQKLALARDELKGSPIIILDEPTAAMDPKAEMELYRRFNALTENKTTFFISHRLASTKFCDYIFCLSQGEIKEKGTHEELIVKNGMYNELYSLQADLYL